VIYLHQTFDLEPASPATRDRFVEHAEATLLPAWAELGGRLKAAFLSSEHWFSQISHVLAFDDLAAFDAARGRIERDSAFAGLREANEALAPVRGDTLLESLGPVADEKLDEGIAHAADEAAGEYMLAILEVAPGRMEDFKKLLSMAAGSLPILASWRDVAGNPARVIDLWRGNPGQGPYAPNSPGLEAFFGPLREVAPRERVERLFPMPYSPLA
jgi:hypothetical protein